MTETFLIHHSRSKDKEPDAGDDALRRANSGVTGITCSFQVLSLLGISHLYIHRVMVDDRASITETAHQQLPSAKRILGKFRQNLPPIRHDPPTTDLFITHYSTRSLFALRHIVPTFCLLSVAHCTISPHTYKYT